MSRWLKIGAIAGAVLVAGTLVLGGATLAFARGVMRGGPAGFGGPGSAWAQGAGHRGGPGGFFGPQMFGGPLGAEGRGGPGHGRGVHGEVTAIDDSTLTVTNRDGDVITVTVSADSRVMLAESQSEGSLEDIDVGANVGVGGRPDDEGVVAARFIVVLPAGDMAGGRVTAVEDEIIDVEDPRTGDAATIVTNAETEFRLGREGEGSLSDVTADKFVMAFGETQENGSLAARLVMVANPGKFGPGGRDGQRGPGPHRGMAAGEVTDISETTFTVDTFWADDEITVQTDVNTQYRNRSGDELSLAEIEVGGMVFVKGQPVDDAQNTILAEVIGIKQ
jgi:hypothetical protein